MTIPSVDNTTLNNLVPNLDIGDVADPVLRLAAFQYIYTKLQDIVTELNSVPTANLQNLSVTTGKIAELSVTAGKLANSAVTTDKINDLAVTLAKMAAGSVGTTQLVNYAVTALKIADGVLTADKFVPGALTNDTQNALRITALEKKKSTGIVPGPGFIQVARIPYVDAWGKDANVWGLFSATSRTKGESSRGNGNVLFTISKSADQQPEITILQRTSAASLTNISSVKVLYPSTPGTGMYIILELHIPSTSGPDDEYEILLLDGSRSWELISPIQTVSVPAGYSRNTRVNNIVSIPESGNGTVVMNAKITVGGTINNFDEDNLWSIITAGSLTYGVNGVKLRSGPGSPEGVLTGKVGDVYSRTDGSATTSLYIKTSGTGNTGWTAK